MLGLIALIAADPVITWAKRRLLGWNGADYVPPKKLFRALAFAVPGLSLLTWLVGLWRIHRASAAVLLPFGVACVLGRYFYNRAAGRPAYLPRALTVDPSDPEYANDLYDLMAFLLALIIVFTPLVAPFFVREP